MQVETSRNHRTALACNSDTVIGCDLPEGWLTPSTVLETVGTLVNKVNAGKDHPSTSCKATNSSGADSPPPPLHSLHPKILESSTHAFRRQSRHYYWWS
jgi:hypothetical protein